MMQFLVYDPSPSPESSAPPSPEMLAALGRRRSSPCTDRAPQAQPDLQSSGQTSPLGRRPRAPHADARRHEVVDGGELGVAVAGPHGARARLATETILRRSNRLAPHPA